MGGQSKLQLGAFTIFPAFGIILPNGHQTITVDCVAEQQGRFDEVMKKYLITVYINLSNILNLKKHSCLVPFTLFSNFLIQYLSHLMGKPTICIGENKDADQLRGNREADPRLCFRYSDSTIPLLLKSEISSF